MVGIAKEAVDRLSAKLAAVKGSGQPVDMAEEFRMLTLQVIGEAILSLPPEECDKARAGCKASLGRSTPGHITSICKKRAAGSAI